MSKAFESIDQRLKEHHPPADSFSRQGLGGSKGGGPRQSLILPKALLPEKLARIEQWRAWRLSVEDYVEEIRPGMQQTLTDVCKLKEPVVKQDVPEKF